jgi:mannose-6-phosphate isomerase-like protein (cupin superfamily)
MNEIEKICDEIRDAELTRNIAYMDNLLSKDLVFRRANGTFADKRIYLEGLSDLHNTYDLLENINCRVDMNDSETISTATVLVKASGKRGESQVPFDGTFKNIRVFRKSSKWELFMWFNEGADNYSIVHVPKLDLKDLTNREGESANFCGKVFLKVAADLPVAPMPRSAYVIFENGGRTKWHYHEGMQILVIKNGEGFVQQKGYPSFNVAVDDIVYIPKDTWHIHGAKVDSGLEHLAITTGNTIWDTNDPCSKEGP